jgi:hypothetical protein
MAGDKVMGTRSHVPGRRIPIHGACGQNFLFCTPRHMTSRAHLGSIRMDFENIARTAPPE